MYTHAFICIEYFQKDTQQTWCWLSLGTSSCLWWWLGGWVRGDKCWRETLSVSFCAFWILSHVSVLSIKTILFKPHFKHVVYLCCNYFMVLLRLQFFSYHWTVEKFLLSFFFFFSLGNVMISSISGEPSCQVHQKDKFGTVWRTWSPEHGLLQQP